MYDLNKRSYISTLGELRELLANLPDETEISGAGAYGAWLHFGKEKNLVCIDPESLYSDYSEEYGDEEEGKEEEQMREHGLRLSGVKENDYSPLERKILAWDRENYNDFVGSFTVNELLELFDETEYVPESCDNYHDYGYCIVDNAAGIIYDYVWKKLKELAEIHAIGEENELANAYLAILAALTP